MMYRVIFYSTQKLHTTLKDVLKTVKYANICKIQFRI